MKRTILLFFSVVSILSALIAAPIERAVALQYAKQFVSQTSVSQFTRSSVPVSEVEAEPAYIAKDATSGTPHFYVYNLSNDNGFVIVAADTRVRIILGYSFNGSFDEKNIPVNMRAWLEEYASQIAYAVQQIPDTVATPAVTSSTSVNVNSYVNPLLGDISYNQIAPYNDLCPMDGDTRSVTGCVATAMVQVMRYHRHPYRGKGIKSYTTSTLNQTLTVDFGATVYDWGNMLPSYDPSATEVQKTAVATLMYHAGVAAEMDYSATGSAASMEIAALGLYRHFDYDIGIDMASRKYYSEEEWLQLIKTELNADRPVIITGYNSESGHAFVCDGYDTDDFLHINWGWGGYQDGYFQISAFNPDLGGTGAGSGNYNSNQSVCYGIQKPYAGSVPNSVVGIRKITVNKTFISGDQKARFNLFTMVGVSIFTFEGQVALALYDNAGNFVKIIKVHDSNIDLDYGYYYTLLSFNDIGISDIRPNESEVGTFSIRPVCRLQGTDTWRPVLVINGNVSEIPAVITDSGISFTNETLYSINVSAHPVAGGTVTGGGTFPNGFSQTVTAEARAGYTFTSWTENGVVVSTEPNYTFIVEKERSLVANFAINKYAVSFPTPANGALKVFNGMTEIQSGTEVEHGTDLRVEALPDVGYKLVSLQANGQDVINDTVTVTGTTEIKAVFERWVNMDNYRIKATNATCPGSNDGKIAVSFGKQLDYTVIVKNDNGFEKTEKVTGTTYSLTGLAAGNYSVCFTIEGATNYKQCFEVVISQPQDLSVFKSAVADNHVTYSLSGGTRYTVTHNGRSMETTGDVIRVPLRRGRNLIRITAENECQGVFEEEMYHTDNHKLILFPNPTTGQFSVILPHGEEEVTVEVISILGQSVMKEKRRVSLNGLISMNISALPNGIYLVKVNGKTVKHVAKVIKK